ncbi:MAG: penicillin-binding protein 2 [Kiritimatiellae bacterium]|nr:penicillin-binding protein 2 [Kiritimatiellia bacterium]
MRGENWRFWVPVVLLLAFAGYSTQKLIRAHVDPDVADIDYTFERDLPGCRGTIYDSFGRSYPLAKSVPIWEYRMDPVALTNRVVRRKGEEPRTRGQIADTIAEALGIDRIKVRKMALNTANRYQFVAISSDPVAHEKLCDSTRVAGLRIEDTEVRQYLHGRLLSHVLGSVNAENVGSAGIELRYNRDLTGVPGKIRGMKDARGHEIYDRRIETISPLPGADIYLTVDHNIQYEVESALKWGMEEFGAASGWCVVMNPATGAILALASRPDFDPLAFGRAPDAAKVNRVTNFTYEPGSVMKVITVAGAIDMGLVRADTKYPTNRNDERYYRLPGDGSHVWEPMMTVGDAVVHSSNIVVGKIGSDMGPKNLWTYMTRFGFGAKTGIELPGEEFGIIRDWRKWDKATWSRAPIGQGVSVTAIQMCSAYQAIANDGLRMKPYIVEKILNHKGEEVYRHTPTPAGRPIKESTAREMRKIMLGVASPAGTARRAAIRGYSVAGKTGTAQKVVDGHYSDSLFRATFCGMVPASDPKLVILVTLDFDEKRKFHQGGNSSGPVFRRIAIGALRYLMIPPDKPEELSDFDDDDEYDRIMEERAQKIGNAAQ